MRKLLTALLVLPFLAGANVGTAVPDVAAASNETISSSAASITQPPLPGHLSASGLAPSSVLPDSARIDSWRAPSGSGRPGNGLTAAALHTAGVRTHLHLTRREHLAFASALARTRASEPVTFGNPPPASPT